MVSAKQRANWARFARMAKARARKAKGRSRPRRVKAPMARRKKARRYGRKKGAPRMDRAHPLGAMAGAAGSGLEILFEASPEWGNLSVADYIKGNLKGTEPIAATGRVLKTKLTELDNYKYLALGVGVSASKSIPVLRIVAKPVDRVIRKMSKGKVSL